MSRMNNILKKCGYDSERRPMLLELRSSKWFITATVATATFTDIFLYGVIVPVIPFALTTRDGVPQEDVQYWVSVLLAVYGAALLGASPPWGYIADKISDRRTPLLFGLVVLAGATALLAVGTSIPLLIVGRVLQGISGAIVWISGLALLVDTVGSANIGQYMGYVGASLSVALLLAPLLGGAVADTAGYEAVFAMCWGCIGVDVVLRLVLIEKKVAVKWLGVEGAYGTRELNTQQIATLSDEEKADAVVEPELDADKEDATSPEDIEKPAAQTEANVPTHTTGVTAPHVVEAEAANPAHQPPPVRTTLEPVMPVKTWYSRIPMLVLLFNPRMAASLYATLIQASLLTSLDSTLPLRTRALFGWTSLGAGLIFLPITIPSFFGPLVGWWIDRHGPRYCATLSFICACPFFILLRLVDVDSFSHKAGLCAILVGIGASLALSLPPILAEISNVVVDMEKEQPGRFGTKGAMAQAYGLFNLSFAAGCLVGPVWGGMINEKAGWGTMSWTLGLLAATTAVPTFLLVGGAYWKRKTTQQDHSDAY